VHELTRAQLLPAYLAVRDQAVLRAGDEGPAAGEAVLRAYKPTLPAGEEATRADLDGFLAFFLVKQARRDEARALADGALASSERHSVGSAGIALAQFTRGITKHFSEGVAGSRDEVLQGTEAMWAIVGSERTGGPAAIAAEMDLAAGEVVLAAGDHRLAASLAQGAIDALIDNPFASNERLARAHRLLGGARESGNEHAAAAESYARALALARPGSPMLSPIAHSLSAALIASGNCDLAATVRTAYQRLRQPDGERTDVRVTALAGYGRILWECNYGVDARHLLLLAVTQADAGLRASDPLRLTVRLQLAVVLLGLDESDAAASLIGQIERMTVPGRAPARLTATIGHLRAELFRHRKQYSKASRLYRDLARSLPAAGASVAATADVYRSWAVALNGARSYGPSLDSIRMTLALTQPLRDSSRSSREGDVELFLETAWSRYRAPAAAAALAETGGAQ